VNADGDRAVLDQPSILLFGRAGRRQLSRRMPLRAVDTFQGAIPVTAFS
jgi:hypothetical protein